MIQHEDLKPGWYWTRYYTTETWYPAEVLKPAHSGRMVTLYNDKAEKAEHYQFHSRIEQPSVDDNY